jgi:hypothetical protein
MTSAPLPLAVLPTSPRPSERGLSLNSSSTLQDTVSTVLAGSVLSSSFPSREETTAHIISTCKYGLPSMDNIIVRKSYVASMNFKTRTPNWVAERIFASNMSETTNVEGVALRHNSQFKSDQSIPESVRANVKDYWKSGYSRGHLAAAASHKHSQVGLCGGRQITYAKPSFTFALIFHNVHHCRLVVFFIYLLFYVSFLLHKTSVRHGRYVPSFQHHPARLDGEPEGLVSSGIIEQRLGALFR